MLISLLVLSLLSSNEYLSRSQADPSTICPEPEVISPCVCTKACPACQAIIECSKILNSDQLNDVFKKSEDWTFWNFVISNSSFQYLPSAAIDVKKVRNLYMRHNVMYALFDVPPPPTNVLQELELTNIILTGGIKWDIFPTLIHLKELNISNFEIRKIDQAFINNFPVHLTGLYFTDTKTQQLGETAFTKLEDLTRIFVRKTEISILQRSMFPEMSNLIAINFSYNKISSLPDDIFTNMPDLTGINFSFTNIVTLTSPVFEDIVPRLRLLYFEGNDIDCGCAMKWVPKSKQLPYYMKVTCTSPTAVKGLSIRDLKESHFYHCE